MARIRSLKLSVALAAVLVVVALVLSSCSSSTPQGKSQTQVKLPKSMIQTPAPTTTVPGETFCNNVQVIYSSVTTLLNLAIQQGSIAGNAPTSVLTTIENAADAAAKAAPTSEIASNLHTFSSELKASGGNGVKVNEAIKTFSYTTSSYNTYCPQLNPATK